MRVTRVVSAACVAATLLAASYANAGIVVDGTRVVYPALKREVTVTIRNSSNQPSLVQAWLDAGDANAKPGESKVPFVLTPPLFRVDPTKAQSMRLVYTHDPLPADRESVFWLNVLDIPPRARASADVADNRLELAFKHRMKVFFRPDGLRGSAANAPSQLKWQLISKDGKIVGIEASNPTPYHVSLTQLNTTLAGHTVNAKADMVEPFASRSFNLPSPLSASGTAAIEYWFVNDYGGNVSGKASASTVH